MVFRRPTRYHRMENKRALRVTKCLGMSPVVGICTACNREFKVPLTEVKKLAHAQESLQLQFNQYKCPGDQTH
jgi:hypothetical protein